MSLLGRPDNTDILRRMEQRITDLATTLEQERTFRAALEAAFNQWFDLVAPELGFKAQTKRNFGGGTTYEYMVAPRQAAKTTPKEEIVRITPKVCAKRRAK